MEHLEMITILKQRQLEGGGKLILSEPMADALIRYLETINETLKANKELIQKLAQEKYL